MTIAASDCTLRVGDLVSLPMPKPKWWRVARLIRWYRDPYQTFKITGATSGLTDHEGMPVTFWGGME